MSDSLSPEPDWASLSKEEATDLAQMRLDEVTAQHKVAKKALLRDWSNLTPGERSAGTRQVKQLEEKQQELREVLQMYRPKL